VAIVDVTRIDTINDAARALLAGMSADLGAGGKRGFVVDPDRIVIRPDRGYDDVVFGTVDDAVVSAQRVLRANPIS
ncbi:MAG TPA: glutaminase A, partial [Mycobacterium sp.]|nr:glutaminase A [Mycobacterium sp.]